MKKYFKILVVLLFVINFSSCDPAKMLLIENKLENTIEIEIELDDCKSSVTQLLKREDFRKIKLGATKNEKIKTYIFGIGVWSKEDLEILRKCTKSITIEETGKPIRKVKGEELSKLLPKKRLGTFNNIIRIKIIK